jgi:hypothetical protein
VYLVADSDINCNGQVKDHKLDNVVKAINDLWDFIRISGHVEQELSITLFGSGRSGIADATKDEILKFIIDSFISSIRNSKSKIVDHLKIIIHPKDVNKLNISEVKKYLEYKCIFAKRPSNQNIQDGEMSYDNVFKVLSEL